MNKMTLIHIGIFSAGVLAGWMLAKNQKEKIFANLNGSFEEAHLDCIGKCGVEANIRCIKDCLNRKGWNSNGTLYNPQSTPTPSTPKSTPKSTTLTN